MNNKMLIVIDMQNDFIDGALGTPEAIGILQNVRDKVNAYKRKNNPVIFTQDTHSNRYLKTSEGKKLPVVHCVKGTPGWKIAACIDDAGCPHVEKNRFGYPYWDLDCLIDADVIDTIEIVGLCTDICVVSNALIIKSLFPDVEIVVDAACCAGTSPEAHNAALRTMKSCQIEVVNG